MELTILIVACLLIGFFAGFMSGMFGIGGGSIRTPLLYAAGLPLLSAFGINLLVIPFSSCIAAISHRKNIDWKFAPYVVIGGTIGSVIGAFLAGFIQTIILAIIFVIVSLITVFGIYLDRALPKLAQRINPNAKFILGGTFFLNLITAMRGGSGGSLFPPFLKAMRLDMHRAIATSLFATIFTAIGAVVIYWYRGDIILLPAVVVIIGSMAGARIGSSLSLRTKSLWLEIGLSIFVIILALIVAFKALLIQ
jgi:uncharacterized membrane protein YfcA